MDRNKRRPSSREDLSTDRIRREAEAYREKRRREEARTLRTQREKKPPVPLSRETKPSQPVRQHLAEKPLRRKRRRQVTPRALASLGVLALALVVLLTVALPRLLTVDASEPAATVQEDATREESATVPFDQTIISDSAILINARNGDVLYAKEADEKRYPASLTKLMTVYVAIQENSDLNKEVTLTREVFAGLYEAGASTSGLVQGETVTIKDLLYATVLPSGGDAAQALALITSGNERAFVQLMNETAQSLGMKSTNFVNPTGLHDPNHYTTCRDLARLIKSGLGNTQFEEVFTSAEYTTTSNNVHPQGLALTSTLQKHMATFDFTFEDEPFELKGAKTGFTPEAGVCLASVAVNERKTCVAVTLHAGGDQENYYPVLKDAQSLYRLAYQ